MRDDASYLRSDSPFRFFPGEFISDTINWAFVWDFYEASGTEAWVTIGNFHNDAQTPFDPTCHDNIPHAYYYFDDVLIEPVPHATFDLSLDADGYACDSFLLEPEINPEFEDALYEWSNGQHGKNITVYESGVYYHPPFHWSAPGPGYSSLLFLSF